MNTLRNLAALALLSFAAISPAHAEKAPENAETAIVAEDADGSSEAIKLLADRPEIVALARGTKVKAVGHELKEQISNAGGERAIADALNVYLSKHPLKDGQNISDLARSSKKKALAKALEENFSKRP
jgi:hypothetical protein